jgi:hypothetical protein
MYSLFSSITDDQGIVILHTEVERIFNASIDAFYFLGNQTNYYSSIYYW